jgi:hypothetical protein
MDDISSFGAKSVSESEQERPVSANWPLMAAVWARDAKAAKAALSVGADAQFEDCEPLRAAVVVGSEAVCEALLGKGAAANARGGAFMRSAVDLGHEGVAKILARNGGLTGWDSAEAMLSRGRMDWLEAAADATGMDAHQATRGLDKMVDWARWEEHKSPRRNIADPVAFVDFLCSKKADTWPATERFISEVRACNNPWGFALFVSLIERADQKDASNLKSLLANWGFWCDCENRQHDVGALMAVVAKRLADFGEPSGRALSEAMALHIGSNAWSTGFKLFELGAGEEGLARSTEKLVECCQGNSVLSRDGHERLHFLAAKSADPKAAFAVSMFKGSPALSAELIKGFLKDPRLAKLAGQEAIWEMAGDWAERHLASKPSVAQWVLQNRAERERAALKSAAERSREDAGLPAQAKPGKTAPRV